MVHPRKRTCVVRPQVQNPSSQRSAPVGEKGNAEPSVDKHGNKLEDIDMEFAWWVGSVPRRLGCENWPAHGMQGG